MNFPLNRQLPWLICAFLLSAGDISIGQERTRPGLPSGPLPALKPPPGVEVTQKELNDFLFKPLDDDLTTPPWERKTEPGEEPRVVRPEVIEIPDEPEPMIRVPEVIAEPDDFEYPEIPAPTIPAGPDVIVENSPFKARQRAMKEGRFMFMAFTGNGWNPVSQKLNQEVFNSETFLNFASEKTVVCLLDYPSKMPPVDSPLGRFRSYYGVRGIPAFVLFDPNGDPFIRKSGYVSGNAETYIAEIKALVTYRENQLKERRDRLASEGFREWRNHEGRVFFGKVTRLDQEEVWFLDPNGRQAKVNIAKLSPDDQAFLTQ